MGSYLSSIFWSDQPQKPADAKYKQGIGSGPATQPQKKPIKANTIGSTRDARQRKKPKGKLNKDMIGKPGNFQHTAHMGASDMKRGVDINVIKSQMKEVTPIQLSSSAPESSPLKSA